MGGAVDSYCDEVQGTGMFVKQPGSCDLNDPGRS